VALCTGKTLLPENAEGAQLATVAFYCKFTVKKSQRAPGAQVGVLPLLAGRVAAAGHARV
jgi:hypothetical protein